MANQAQPSTTIPSDWYETFAARAVVLAARLGLGPGAVPSRTVPDEGAYVRAASDALLWAYTERGRETAERVPDVDTLLWVVFRDLTFGMSVAWEKAHRRRGEDVRRQIFAHQCELIARADPAWADRLRAHQDRILAQHPFDDQLARRADRWGELMAAGMPRAQAVEQATREFPDAGSDRGA